MHFLDNYFNFENDTITCGLTEELNVFYVLSLFKKCSSNVIVFTSSLYEANKYFNLIQTYTEDVLLYVMDDFLSSMVKTSSPELKLTRLNTLDKMQEGKHIIVVNLMAFLKFLPKINNNQNLIIEKGQKINRDEVIQKLASLGYRRESLTTFTGEFSVRGMIVDVFLINELHPIRIEFDDDIIDNIRYFDENSQTSINDIDKIILKPVDEIVDNEVSSFFEYADNPNVVFIDKPQIIASYKKLVEDILEYKQSTDTNKKLMFDVEDINIKINAIHPIFFIFFCHIMNSSYYLCLSHLYPPNVKKGSIASL